MLLSVLSHGSTWTPRNICFMTAAHLCCGFRKEYECFYGNHFSPGEQEMQQHPTVVLGCISAFRCHDAAGDVSIGPHGKTRTSVSDVTPLPFCHLLFLLLSPDFKAAGAIFLTLLSVAKVWRNVDCYGRFWHFYQSFRVQMTDRNFNRLERIFFPGFCLKSMWMRQGVNLFISL